jgi:hypothetical protein
VNQTPTAGRTTHPLRDLRWWHEEVAVSVERLPEDDGPVPGDPRDPGPRPNAVPKDLAWACLAAALAGVTVAQLVGLMFAVTRPGLNPSGGGLFLGFLVTVVWLLTIYWVAMGAWRRSVWGCPFHHVIEDQAKGQAEDQAAGMCPRHALVVTRRRVPGSDGRHDDRADGSW